MPTLLLPRRGLDVYTAACVLLGKSVALASGRAGMRRRWVISPPWSGRDDAARRCGVSPIVAQLLYNRGVTERDHARAFLDPQLNALYPPEDLPGTAAAAEIIARKVRERRPIVIYGDYDVDGITGTAILWHVLRLAGAAATVYVPHRIDEGYGLNGEALRQLHAAGADTVITVDCGVTAVEEAKLARQLGLTLIVTDHHTPGPTLPAAAAIVHPTAGGRKWESEKVGKSGNGATESAIRNRFEPQRCEEHKEEFEHGGTENAEKCRTVDPSSVPSVSPCSYASSESAIHRRDAGATPQSTIAPYPNPDLSGAGVAFKLAWAVAQAVCRAKRVTQAYRDFLLDATSLAALGTIADVVPLVGENRVLARYGLTGLAASRLAGIRALIESARLTDTKLSSEHIGFGLAPRLNAAGRMGHALEAVEMLTSADENRSREIALYLEEQNRSRQALERRIFKEACQRIDADGLASDARRGIVLASEDWHAGVIGIVASRIVERYDRPTVMIALSNGEGQGSARSIRPFHLHDALADCREHLITFGGHAMAAGLRIETANINAFTEAFVARANQRLTAQDLMPALRLDGELPLTELSEPVVREIERLSPFGMGNPKPRFASPMLELQGEPRLVGRSGDHLQFALTDGRISRKAIAFGRKDCLQPLLDHRRCRVAFEPILNTFNGRTSVELQVVDVAFPDESTEH